MSSRSLKFFEPCFLNYKTSAFTEPPKPTTDNMCAIILQSSTPQQTWLRNHRAFFCWILKRPQNPTNGVPGNHQSTSTQAFWPSRLSKYLQYHHACSLSLIHTQTHAHTLLCYDHGVSHSSWHPLWMRNAEEDLTAAAKVGEYATKLFLHLFLNF